MQAVAAVAAAVVGVEALRRLLQHLLGTTTPLLPPGVQKRRVVVIGGGPGGATVAKSLQDVADVTLVDSKEFFDIKWASPRALVEPAWAEKVYFAHTEYLKNAKLVVGTVTGVSSEAKEVHLEDGTTLPFDFLVIATGFGKDQTISLKDKIASVHAGHERLKASKNILVVGGGPTGVELAGEVLSDFPEKTVTLVHGGSRLMEFISPRASKLAQSWMQSKGAKLIFNDKVEGVSPDQWGSAGVFKTKGGLEIPTDYLMVATGARPQAGWLAEAFPSAVKSALLEVDPYLRVAGQDSVFALGDVADLKDLKLGYLAKGQAAVVVENIKRLLYPKAGKAAPVLKKYPPAPAATLVSMGRNHALIQTPIGAFSGWLPTQVKSKNMFVDKTRDELGIVDKKK